jgi:hypothetical protein
VKESEDHQAFPTEEQDGLDHIKAARALLARSCLVRFDGNQIKGRSQDDFEAEHIKTMDPEYGRLMCWILFSVGSEYLIKGVLMATSGNFRKGPFPNTSGKCAYRALGDAIGEVKKLKLNFAKQDGSSVDVGQFLRDTLEDIRNRDVHYYAQDRRKQDHSKVTDLAAAFSKLLETVSALPT